MTTSDFLRACRGLPVGRTPVWFMRQAGRSLPEYRRVRAGIGMLEACARPDLVTEITLQPVRRYEVDAAILYSDIVVPVHAAGVPIRIESGVGPVLDPPVRTARDVDALPALDPAALDPVARAVRLLVAELGDTPLIGFAGAPFTVASYLVEGGPSRDHARTKSLMVGDPGLWDALLSRIAEMSATALLVQVGAGAAAVQLFDSWAGALSRADYERFVAPYSARVLAAVAAVSDVPRIHFGVGTGELLAAMAAVGADVVGIDFRVPLDEAARRVAAVAGPRPVQGNLDPALLLAPWEALGPRVDAMLRAGRAAPGHVANLGHGVLPQTDPDQLARVVERVHAFSPAAVG
ncbi:MAG: uroporphyrinogen decarboxylase [Kineosporiaceae bacterium]